MYTKMVDEPVPIISPQKLLSKHLRYQHIKLLEFSQKKTLLR